MILPDCSLHFTCISKISERMQSVSHKRHRHQSHYLCEGTSRISRICATRVPHERRAGCGRVAPRNKPNLYADDKRRHAIPVSGNSLFLPGARYWCHLHIFEVICFEWTKNMSRITRMKMAKGDKFELPKIRFSLENMQLNVRSTKSRRKIRESTFTSVSRCYTKTNAHLKEYYSIQIKIQ